MAIKKKKREKKNPAQLSDTPKETQGACRQIRDQNYLVYDSMP